MAMASHTEERPTIPAPASSPDVAEFEAQVSDFGEWRARLRHLERLLQKKGEES